MKLVYSCSIIVLYLCVGVDSYFLIALLQYLSADLDKFKEINSQWTNQVNTIGEL